MSDQTDLLQRAARVLPGGVLGSHRSGPGLEFVVREGRGAYLWDMSGRRYLDYMLGSGPLLLGHAHPAVVEAVQRQVAAGSTFFALTEPVILLAEQVTEAVPCGEAVRFQTTGSEATFAALRLARAATGRDKVLKFEGGWHGGHDVGQLSAAPAAGVAFPEAVPDCDGIPASSCHDVLVAPFNNAGT